MKIRNILFVAAAVFMLSGTIWAEGMKQPQVSYSADKATEMMVQGQFMSMEGKVFYTPGKEREETVIQGYKQISITRRDKGVMWRLMPDQGMYMENSLDSPQTQSTDLSGFDIKREKIGSEELNGFKTIKYKMIMTSPDGLKYGGFTWINSDGILIKMKSLAKIDGKKIPMNIELTNLKVGKQDPALFEIPAGYRKVSMGGLGSMMQHRARRSDSSDDSKRSGFPSMDKLKGMIGF